MTELAERISAQAVSPEEAKEKVKEKGAELREQASDRLRQEVQTRAEQAGEQAQKLSQSMRLAASELERQGQQGQGAVLEQVALRAEQVSNYLVSADPDALLEDARQYGRRGVELMKTKPWLVAPLGVAVGVVSARVLAARDGSQGS
jgi:hypothetical protein